MLNIMPKEEKFFVHFRTLAKLLVDGAKVSSELFCDLKQASLYASRMREIEQKADEATHNIIDLLHKTFITPLDREDIHKLATRMDDVIDFMDATAQRINLYDVKTALPSALELSELNVKATQAIQRTIDLIENMKNRDNILKACVEINSLENESDHIFRFAMGKLFREEPDTRELIKAKEIYEMMEATMDRCEDVAHIIEGIILEYA